MEFWRDLTHPAAPGHYVLCAFRQFSRLHVDTKYRFFLGILAMFQVSFKFCPISSACPAKILFAYWENRAVSWKSCRSYFDVSLRIRSFRRPDCAHLSTQHVSSIALIRHWKLTTWILSICIRKIFCKWEFLTRRTWEAKNLYNFM